MRRTCFLCFGLFLNLAPLCGAQGQPSIHATLANPAFHKVLACGHRGAMHEAPENTIPSFERALALFQESKKFLVTARPSVRNALLNKLERPEEYTHKGARGS